jgi:hypothetical protein
MKSRFAALLAGLCILGVCALATGPVSADRTQAAQKSDKAKGPPKPSLKEDGKKKNERPKLPGQAMWNLKTIAASFHIVGTDYDPASRQITWSLEAKNQVACTGYRAVFLDADQVQWADVGITLAPSGKEYEKGARVKAVLKLPAKEEFQEANTVTIHPGKPSW